MLPEIEKESRTTTERQYGFLLKNSMNVLIKRKSSYKNYELH